ncbi:TonB-dependent receptor [Pseudoalteromonas sp. C2R02]|uniref:TonB-dependent receptor n=1 Tax=Pseudoalteromonas sp. C2R02 TaxID=2841565 RepID=UPI001C089B4D|nr:TonB-dependent receptor [Pseudoalteromonas sp. C2R02]MBU2969421.1 TonB-dependent receptor [Pseudoalteromonas sp. C2R02]
MRVNKIAVAIIASSILLTQLPAMASDTSSAIRGQVVDSTGMALSNITIKVTHLPTGKVKTLTTTEGGLFKAKGLPVGGPYSVMVTDGTDLKFDNINDLFLQLGQASKVNLVAEAVQKIERIEVSGQMSMAGAYRKGPSKDFNEGDINNSAAISRDLKSVLQRDSRMVVDPTADGGPALSIAGGNVRGNSLTVDGVKQNDDFGLNKNGYPGRRTPISLDAIEQLAVNIAPFEVTYGDFQGGNVNIVTKSGTNEFHGSAFYYRSDDSMTGDKSEGEDLNIGDFSEDIYGFTLGGPLIEDELFFFASYEKFDATKPYQFTLDNENGVVDPNEKTGVTQGDFDRISQIAQDVWNYDIGGYNNASDEEDEKLLLKLDWFINDDHRSSLTYQDNEGNTVRDYWAETFPNAIWATAESNRYNMNESLKAYSLQVFSDWNDDLSTEFKYARKEVNTEQVPLMGANFAQFLIGTPNGGQLYIGPDQFRHANALANDRDMLKFKADYYLNDEHFLTFGIEHEKLDIVNTFVFGSLGMTTFDSIESFENNAGFHVFQNALTGDASDAVDEFQYTTTTFYAQDEWLITDDLTLTYGFRYTKYKNDDKPVLNQNFVERHGYSNQNNYDGLDLFEPRFGANYTYDDDTIIRGGIGLFGGGAPNVWLSNSYGNDGVRKTFAGCFGECFDGKSTPQEVLDFLAAGGFSGGNSDTNSIDPNFEIPSTWKLNLGIERRQDLGMLGDNWQLSADVLFSKVKDAAIYRELNMIPVQTAPDGRPIYDSPEPFDLSLTNTNEGEGQVWSFNADKNFYTEHGNFNFSMGYSYQDITEVNPGNAFVAFEGYSMPANSDFQSETVFNSEFEVRHIIAANLTWTHELFGDNLTTVALMYNGREGRHYSHTMRTAGTFGGFVDFASWDGYNSQSLYVPTGENDPLVTYADGFDKEGFFDYINGAGCLSAGTISRRHACTSSWINRFDLHMAQEINISGEQKLEITFDIENVGNLLNDDWGRADSYVQPFNAPVVDVSIVDGQYVYDNFTQPTPTVAKIPSVWKAQFGIRYKF